MMWVGENGRATGQPGVAKVRNSGGSAREGPTAMVQGLNTEADLWSEGHTQLPLVVCRGGSHWLGRANC